LSKVIKTKEIKLKLVLASEPLCFESLNLMLPITSSVT